MESFIFIITIAVAICMTAIIISVLGALTSFLRTEFAYRWALKEIKKGERSLGEIGKCFMKAKGSYTLSEKNMDFISKAVLEQCSEANEFVNEYRGKGWGYTDIACELGQKENFRGKTWIPEFYSDKGDIYTWIYIPVFTGVICAVTILVLEPFVLFGPIKGAAFYCSCLLLSAIKKYKKSSC